MHAGPDVHTRIGQLTRQLHSTLSELGCTDQLRAAVGELPDVQSRLGYITRLTGAAADKVLTHVEHARAQQERIANATRHLAAALAARQDVVHFLADIEHANAQTNVHLSEITQAQDFHDLTGQVIARVVHLASTLEQQLVQLLLQTAPQPKHSPSPDDGRGVGERVEYASRTSSALQGPVIHPQQAAPDVLTDQTQVDDLLASLGF